MKMMKQIKDSCLHAKQVSSNLQYGLFFSLLVLLMALSRPNLALASGWNLQTLDSGAGQGASTVVYGGNPHVFDRDGNGALRHCWWTGSSWPCEVLDSQVGGQGRIATVVTGSQLHVFYSYLYPNDPGTGLTDYMLAHRWYDTSWHFELLGPHFSAGGDVAATVYSSNPHVFYTDIGSGSLRHAWWTGSSWQFEFLDGNGSSGTGGRSKWSLGDAPSTLVYGSQLHVFYDNTTTGTLRHAWYNWGGSWGFENLDGPGSPGSNGRASSAVTSSNNGTTALLYGGNPHVFFTGQYTGLRHCWWSGTAWYCQTLDGTPFADNTDAIAKSSQPAASMYYGRLDVFYTANNDLYHMWYGNGWNKEILDYGSYWSTVGKWPSSMQWGGQVHVYYQGHHDLDHKWYTP